MARPREFDVDEALERAMQIFWSKGYEATSLHDLTDVMGLSKSSFYDTFGSKHELFLSTIDRYNETVASRRVAALIESAANPKAGITAVFECFVGELLNEAERRGCFVNNCAVETAPCDGAAAARVAAGFAYIEAAFFDAVQRAQEAGDITVEHDPRALARYLTACFNGLIVMAKADPERAVLDDIVNVTLAVLD